MYTHILCFFGEITLFFCGIPFVPCSPRNEIGRKGRMVPTYVVPWHKLVLKVMLHAESRFEITWLSAVCPVSVSESIIIICEACIKWKRCSVVHSTLHLSR